MSKEQESPQMPSMSRPQKRKMYNQFGLLKQKNMQTTEGRELSNRLKQEGNDAHTLHVNKTNDSISDQIQIKLDASKVSWKETGYNTAEIELLEEAWLLTTIKDKETYRVDKKESKRLMREANNLKSERLNANNNS